MRKITATILFLISVICLSSAGAEGKDPVPIFSPIMRPIPDIIIGDYEDGNSNNIFEFPEAFVFDQYVADQDTTATYPYIKWCFKYLPRTTHQFSINGIGPEPGNDFTNPVNVINPSVNASATLRDETLSPSSGTPPYPDTDETYNMLRIALYVSDGIFVQSQEVRVYSYNDAQDGYSLLMCDNHWEESFCPSYDWRAYAGTDYAPSSIASYSNDSIIMKWPSYPLPNPGFFQWIQMSPGNPSQIYAQMAFSNPISYILRARMLSNKDTSIPAFRLRAQAINNVWTACTVFGADGANPDQKGAPQTNSQDFYMMVTPQGTSSDAFIAADIFTGNPNTGEIYIDELELYDLSGGYMYISENASISDFGNWITFDDSVSITTDTIILNDPGANRFNMTGQFVNLSEPLQPNTFYRLTYNLAKTDGDGYTEQFRLRVADTYNGAYSSNVVYNDNNPDAVHLSKTPKKFYLCHYAMNPRSYSPAGDLTVCLDSIESNPEETNPGIVLTGIKVEKITLLEDWDYYWADSKCK